MSNTSVDIGVARQIGSYSDAVAVAANARWLFTSGTPGLALDGRLARRYRGTGRTGVGPHRRHAEAGRHDRRGSRQGHPLLLIVPELVRPEFLLEIEAYAARS